MNDELPDLWTCCALLAGAIAKSENRLEDSKYVRDLAYSIYNAELKEKNNSICH